MLDEARFATLWTRLHLRGDPRPTFEALRRAYTDPTRAYHTAEHIRDCLEQLDLARDAAEHPDEVELALWFHDAVYDPRANDNEERSAAWAADVIAAAGGSAALRDRVRSLILTTRHEASPLGRDAQLVSDIDLSILGRDAATFAEFEKRIRQEYAWVPEPEYRRGRRAVLAHLLAREPLYQAETFRQRYEGAAQQNLQRALDRLSVDITQ